MKIGIHDSDQTGFPNLALMKISAYHKAQGDTVEWCREALTLAHIAEFKGQDKGQSADAPLRTITASVGEFATVYAKVVRYTPDTDMGYWPEVRALLNKY